MQLANICTPTAPVYGWVFGSTARQEPDPGDCDLLVISDDGIAHGAESELRCDFAHIFGLRLHLLVLTVDEAREMRPVLDEMLAPGARLVAASPVGLSPDAKVSPNAPHDAEICHRTPMSQLDAALAMRTAHRTGM